MKMNPLKDEQTALAILAIILAVVALWAIGCGGGGGSYSTPSTPTTTTPTPSGTTININSSSGSGAFSPNPVQVASGATIIFKNNTSDTHILVMNDGTSLGTVGPNASLTKTLTGSGGNYHCTNHPSMVGSINGAAAPPEPTPNPSGGYDYLR